MAVERRSLETSKIPLHHSPHPAAVTFCSPLWVVDVMAGSLYDPDVAVVAAVAVGSTAPTGQTETDETD